MNLPVLFGEDEGESELVVLLGDAREPSSRERPCGVEGVCQGSPLRWRVEYAEVAFGGASHSHRFPVCAPVLLAPVRTIHFFMWDGHKSSETQRFYPLTWPRFESLVPSANASRSFSVSNPKTISLFLHRFGTRSSLPSVGRQRRLANMPSTMLGAGHVRRSKKDQGSAALRRQRGSETLIFATFRTYPTARWQPANGINDNSSIFLFASTFLLDDQAQHRLRSVLVGRPHSQAQSLKVRPSLSVIIPNTTNLSSDESPHL